MVIIIINVIVKMENYSEKDHGDHDDAERGIHADKSRVDGNIGMNMLKWKYRHEHVEMKIVYVTWRWWTLTSWSGCDHHVDDQATDCHGSHCCELRCQYCQWAISMFGVVCRHVFRRKTLRQITLERQPSHMQAHCPLSQRTTTQDLAWKQTRLTDPMHEPQPLAKAPPCSQASCFTENKGILWCLSIFFLPWANLESFELFK